MQILILAAGMGRRLAELTDEFTKCMVKVNGTSLINRALDSLVKHKPERIVLVVGYQGDKLRDYIGDNYKGIEVVYINNPIYDTTNNIYSLFLAKKEFEEKDTILLESDLIFDDSVINRVLENKHLDNCVVVDKYQAWMDGTVVSNNSKGEITQFISKSDFNFENIDNYYKTVNIYWFKKEFTKKHYVPFLEAYCKSVGYNEYYENVLKVLALLNNLKLNTCVLEKDNKWYEIDDKQDLHNAETLFSDDIGNYQNRYGGYWRFPFLKDFCYLVNPYFPSKKMVSEFKAYFETLLHDYPSTGKVQNLLAAKIFNCNPNQILVANGAAEIISNLMCSFGDDKIGVITPTFHEYIARAPEEKLVRFTLDNEDFSYNLEDLKTMSQQVSVLLLINPDNPSGNFIPKRDIIILLEYMRALGKTLILDESFVDFSSENEENSLINREILTRFSNLIIIKSISKSYGVPGIRLGLMVSNNTTLMETVKSKLPVWNINSFGEFFLQIFGKYESDYKIACEKIAEERDRFYEELNKIPFIHPIKSQANYFLCKVTDISATELTKYMMKNFNILLKDCTSKTAFDNKEFIRIAVRDYDDNNYLLDSLSKVKL